MAKLPPIPEQALSRARLYVSSGLSVPDTCVRIESELGTHVTPVALQRALAKADALESKTQALASHSRLVVKYAALIEQQMDAAVLEADPMVRALAVQGLAKPLSSYAAILGPWLRAQGLDPDKTESNADIISGLRAILVKDESK